MVESICDYDSSLPSYNKKCFIYKLHLCRSGLAGQMTERGCGEWQLLKSGTSANGWRVAQVVRWWRLIIITPSLPICTMWILFSQIDFLLKWMEITSEYHFKNWVILFDHQSNWVTKNCSATSTVNIHLKSCRISKSLTLNQIRNLREHLKLKSMGLMDNKRNKQKWF